MATFKKRSLFILSLFLLSILTVLPIIPMVKSAPTIYEYYNTGDDDARAFFGVHWRGQTFTVGATGHTVTSIKLKLLRVGNPGTLTVSIRETSGGVPTGADKTNGTMDGNTISNSVYTWYEISVTEYTLSANTKYAIVFRAINGDDSNKIYARLDYTNPLYAGGGYESSDNSGSSWGEAATIDAMFEVWGNAGNHAPTNDACDSTAIFYKDLNGWVNVTVSDVDLVADLKTVDIQVNTTYDSETFTLRWTQATGIFSEVSDASNICTLGSSIRVNLDADTDKIAFQFKFTGGTLGYCDVKATSTDDTDATDTDIYPLEFLYTTSDANPSFISTFTTGGIGYPYQRNKFYANGRFWDFWGDGTNLVYSSSTDGTTWAAKITVRACATWDSWAIHFDGVYAHYVHSNGDDDLKYRRFTPNADGSITYSAAEQNVAKATTYAYLPSIIVDSSGYVWIGHRGYTGTWWYPCVAKSSNNDGTWGAGTSWALYGNDATASNIVLVIALTGGKVLALVSYNGMHIVATAWNGVAWVAGTSTPSEIKYAGYFSAVAEDDDVHLTFIENTSYDIDYTEYIYSTNIFTAETTLQAGNSAISIPSICFDPVTSNLYVFWASYPTANHIFYRKYDSATSTWEARVDWITEAQAIVGSPSSFYNAYGTYIAINYVTGNSSPYTLKFAFLGFPTFSSSASITGMNADNWVFAEYKYYTFIATYVHATNWSLIDSMRVQFNDGDGLIQIQYRLSTAMYTVLSGDDKVVIRIISAENTSLTTYQITFGVYFTKNVVDTYDLELYTWMNSTIGETFYYEAATDYFNIYNLGGRTEYQELGDESLSSHPVKSDPFDLQVIDGAGGDIEVNVTYRNLQQVSILTHLIIPADYIGSQYAGEWSAEYGIYYYADGSWTRGWNVVLEFSNGFISNKDYWVYVHSRWYRNDGILVGGSEYFSSFFKPGLVNGTTVWVDLWFSNTNSSTAGAGRVSAEYYGMRDSNPWFKFWYSDWGPMMANQTMSYYEMPLLNSTGGVISSRDVELVKVYSRLYKITSTSYTVEVKAPEVFDRKIARGDFTGIPTPPFVPPKVMDMPQGGMFGLLQTFLASLIAAITQALSPAFATCVAILDGIFAWAGWPGGFTQITTWINDLAGFMVSAMGWMMTLLTSIFGFFTTTVPSFLYIVTTALTTYIDMIGKFWGYFTGLFGTGFDIWNDFNGPQWVTIGILLYPLYLLTLWAERGLEPVLVHLDFWGGMIMGLINLAINLAGLVWSFISGLIENIPVVE